MSGAALTDEAARAFLTRAAARETPESAPTYAQLVAARQQIAKEQNTSSFAPAAESATATAAAADPAADPEPAAVTATVTAAVTAAEPAAVTADSPAAEPAAEPAAAVTAAGAAEEPAAEPTVEKATAEPAAAREPVTAPLVFAEGEPASAVGKTLREVFRRIHRLEISFTNDTCRDVRRAAIALYRAIPEADDPADNETRLAARKMCGDMATELVQIGDRLAASGGRLTDSDVAILDTVRGRLFDTQRHGDVAVLGSLCVVESSLVLSAVQTKALQAALAGPAHASACE